MLTPCSPKQGVNTPARRVLNRDSALGRSTDTSHGRQRTHPDVPARRPDHRGLLARRGAVLLAHPGTEDRLRPRRPAVGLHGHADLVRDAHPPRPRRRPAGLRRPPAHDEDGAADASTCPAEAVEDVRRLLLVMQRLDRGRMVCELQRRQGRRRDRAVARARRHGLRHDAHDSVGRLRRLGPAQQAQGGVPRPARRQDPRPAPVRRAGDARGAHAAAGLHRRHQPGRPGQLPAGVTRRRS